MYIHRDVLYSTAVIKNLYEMRGKDGRPEFAGGTDTCICPSCSHEIPHVKGKPCNQVKCPKCSTPMTGKGAPGEIK